MHWVPYRCPPLNQNLRTRFEQYAMGWSREQVAKMIIDQSLTCAKRLNPVIGLSRRRAENTGTKGL